MQDILQALNWRYATKQFDAGKKISAEDFQVIKESLRLAPSSFGLQPWKFIQVEDKKIRQQLKESAWGQSQLTDASHVVVLCRRNSIDESLVDAYMESTASIRGIKVADLQGLRDMIMGLISSQTPEAVTQWAEKQIYIALGFALETAAIMGIDACPMEGFDKQKFDNILGLDKQNLSSVVIAVFGYRSQEDKYATQTKSRFSETEVFLSK
jgi:nitroreductase